MKLKHGGTYKRRDGKFKVTVEKDTSNGTNYTFKSVDVNGNISWYLESGHILSEKAEHNEDLVSEI